MMKQDTVAQSGTRALEKVLVAGAQAQLACDDDHKRTAVAIAVPKHAKCSVYCNLDERSSSTKM